MYLEFFGLRELPFELTPNPRFLFLTTRHREALASLRHGIGTAKGILALVGEAGTGKTTLLRAFLNSETQKQVHCLYLNNPTLTRGEFVQFLARGFRLSAAAATSKTTMLFELEEKLKRDRADGIIYALVIDEAQSLPHELLEEIRLLANIDTDTEKLLPVVLAGQPELADRLNDPSLRQLKQRVSLRCELAPLTLPETASYIASRLRIAGGETARIFTRDAVMMIYERSRGIPRTISVLCDNALVTGLALNTRPVGRDIVLEVCRDFDVESSTAQAAAPSTAPPAAETPAPPAPEPPAELSVEAPPVAEDSPVVAKRRRFSFLLN
jgi:general secretion pathway protein A